MRVRVSLLIVFILLFCGSITNANPSIPVNASAAILMDAATGEVLYSKNPHTIMAPASTTKIMTAIIAIENGNLDQRVRVSRRAANMPGTSMQLHTGELPTLQDLLYGLLLSSGNDAASTIAEYISGSEERFARRMTAKAQTLGMVNTKFKNASGLPAAGHYTTAHDMAKLARYALKNPIFASIVQTKIASVPSSRSTSKHSLVNHNKLLWQYPYTTGIKTGYTRRAGRCLVASASQNNISLISVILKSGTMYNDTIQLFDFGFKKALEKAEVNSTPTPTDSHEIPVATPASAESATTSPITNQLQNEIIEP